MSVNTQHQNLDCALFIFMSNQINSFTKADTLLYKKGILFFYCIFPYNFFSVQRVWLQNSQYQPEVKKGLNCYIRYSTWYHVRK